MEKSLDMKTVRRSAYGWTPCDPSIRVEAKSPVPVVLAKERWEAETFPLSFFRNHTPNIMKIELPGPLRDTLDRPFAKEEIHSMMENSGLEIMRFKTGSPFLCAVG